MRRLILVRHAKAVEEDVAGDHARGLSERGRADAQSLGQGLGEQGLVPELVLCSTAVRTRQTQEAISRNVATILSDRLYLASPAEMLAQVQAADDAVQTVLLVGHNPGVHSLLAMLVGEYADEADADRMLLKFPTSACAVMAFDAARWKDVAVESARLEALRY